jgi:hypothetical protein
LPYRPLELPNQSEQLMIDAEPQVSLSRAIMQQEGRNARHTLDAKAQSSEIKGQDLQRVNCSRGSISPKVYRKLNTGARERNTTFRSSRRASNPGSPVKCVIAGLARSRISY